MARFLPLLLVLAAAGCGHSIASKKDYENVYIQGTVTVNGQPLTAGSVTFVPENGRPFKGFIWRNGKYEVYNTRPGKAKIVLNGEETGFQGPGGGGGGRGARSLAPAQPVKLPAQYLAANTTPLEFTIGTSSQKHDINLPIDAAEWIKLNPNLPVPVAPPPEKTEGQ